MLLNRAVVPVNIAKRLANTSEPEEVARSGIYTMARSVSQKTSSV